MINDVDPGYDVCSVPKDQAMMAGKNIGDLLNAGGVTWGGFMAGFDLETKNANGTTGCKRSTHSTVVGTDVIDYIPHHNWFQYYASTANPSHARPSSPGGDRLHASSPTARPPDPANHQYGLQDFYDAVKAGNFPAVSFIKLPAYQDGHAGYSDPLDEQAGTAALINFLQQQPGWKNTAVVITWDDSDGWYDHAFAQSDQRLVRYRGGPARRTRQVRHGQADGGRDRASGERPLRSRHARAVSGHLAVGQGQLREPRAHFAGLGGALHRGQLAAWRAARRRLVRRLGRIAHGSCSTSGKATGNPPLCWIRPRASR